MEDIDVVEKVVTTEPELPVHVPYAGYITPGIASFNSGQFHVSLSGEVQFSDEINQIREDAENARDAAEASAHAAATSEQNAKESEDNAKDSETAAANSASRALASENAAEAAQEAAEDAQAAAETAENNAKASETAAQGYASAASGSATGAAASAGQASDSAQEAASSAAKAGQFASAAAISASQAAGSAEDAATSAQAAQDSADRAQEIVDGIGSVYKPVGSIPFARLPAMPSEEERGYVYNITDNFTTDARFVEGAGESYPAGSNVAVVLSGTEYKYDVLSGSVDLSNYAQVNGAYPNMQVGEATRAQQDGNGNNIAQTYAKQAGTYSGLTAGRAVADADGNNISDTYAKIDEITPFDDKGTYPNVTVGMASNASQASELSVAERLYETESSSQWYRIGHFSFEANKIASATYLVEGALHSSEPATDLKFHGLGKTLMFGILSLQGVCLDTDWGYVSMAWVAGSAPMNTFCWYKSGTTLVVCANGSAPQLNFRLLSAGLQLRFIEETPQPVTLPDTGINYISDALPFLETGKRIFRIRIAFDNTTPGTYQAVTLSNEFFGDADDYPVVGDYIVDVNGQVAMLTQDIGGTPEHTVYILGKRIPYYILPPDGINEYDINTNTYNALNTVRQTWIDDVGTSIGPGNNIQLQFSSFQGYLDESQSLIFYAKGGGNLYLCVGNIEQIIDSMIDIYVVDAVNVMAVKSVNGQTGAVVIDSVANAGKVSNKLTLTVNGQSTEYDGSSAQSVTISTDSSNDPEAVKFTPQTLTSQQQTQARSNIGAYAKPAGGIPESDLSTDVQASLALADSAYQKPSTGIPETDLSSSVRDSLDKANSALQSAPVTSVNGQTGAVTLDKGDVGLGNVDNVRQYSTSNPPPYPVTSVNGKTGAASLSASDVGAATPAQVNSISMVPNTGNSGTRVNISVPASNGFIEGSAIPYNGWLVFNCHTTATQYLNIRCVDSSGADIYDQLSYSITQGAGYPIFFYPVKAGQRLKLTYNIADVLSIWLIPGQQIS